MASVKLPWFCPSCSMDLPGNPIYCRNCDTPRPKKGWPDRDNPPPEEEEAPARVGLDTEKPRRPCPQCDGFIAAGKTTCVFCGFSEACSAFDLVFEGVAVCRISRAEQVDLGREIGPLTGLLLPHDNVSRNHCTLRFQETLQVKDNSSKNSTFINGVKVGTGWVEVPEGATLRLASNVNFRVTGTA